MAARIMRVENAVRDDAENITDGGSLTVFTS